VVWSIVCDMPSAPLSDILLETVVNGAVLDCSPATPLSLDQVKALGQDKIIDARIIRDILTGKIVPAATRQSETPQSGTSQASPPPLDPRGIRIRGAWVRGVLDLDGVETKIGLRLTACRLDAFTMQDASLRWLELDTCVLPPATADRAQIGTLTIRGCWLTGKCPDGALRLANAHVASELRVSGTHIENEAGPALMAAGLTVGAGAFMDGLSAAGATAAAGAVCLKGATITGQLSLRGATLINSSGPALMADSVTIQGAAFLDQGFTATGTGGLAAVRLVEAKVSGMLTLCGATLVNDTGPALVADLLTAQGDVLMTWDASNGKPFKATAGGAEGTVRLRGANISGQLSLEKAQITSRLSASGTPASTAKTMVPVGDASPARSAGAACMTGAVVGSDLVLCGAILADDNGPALMADYLTVKGDAFGCEEPGQGFTATGAGDLGVVCIGGATITGQLSLRGTTLTNSGSALTNSSGPALMADSATIQGAAFLDQGFTATGTGRLGAVRLVEAKVSGMLTLCGATLVNDTGPALVADLLTAQHHLLMTWDASNGKPFKATAGGAEGTVRLRGANISGQLSLEKAQITSRVSASGTPASTAKTMVPVGDASPARSAGAVCMTGAVVGSDLVLCGAILADDNGPALMADSVTIQGAACLDQSFTALGTDKELAAVQLADASIAKELRCRGRTINWHPDGQALALSLALAKVGTLVYDPGFARKVGGEAHGLMDWDGLTYTGLPRLPKEQEHQNKKKPENEWISCLGKGRTAVYAAQPYQELAAAYQGAGNHDAARRVLIAQRDDARERGRLSFLSKTGQWILKLLIGYGYRSTQALAWLAALFVLTALAAVFYFGPKELIVSVPAPTSGQATPTSVVCSVPGRISYAIEVAFPIVSLSSSSEEHCDVPATGAKSWLLTFGWIVRALAATLVAFYLAGLAGITRNS